MKIKTLIGLLLVDFLQTACVNNAQKTECVDNVQKTEQTKNDEPIVSIIDETSDPDSVYSSCSKKFADLMKHPDEKHFFELENEFEYADDGSELLLYYLVAANKLGLDVAKIRVANSLTQSLSNPNVGKHTKEIALFYLKKWESSTRHKRGKMMIELFDSLSTDETEFIVPEITCKSTDIQRLKVGSLKGSASDYNKLKELMSTDGMYVFLLYYSYIMADRYDYLPAKKDVVTIISDFYKEYNLGPIDKDTEYFCGFFM